MKIEHARILALHLFKREGLTAEFKINTRAKTLAGRCSYNGFYGHKTHIRIELSKWYVESNTDDKVLNTILHEMAHAFAPIGAGHNQQWRKVCKELGMTHISTRTEKGTQGKPVAKWHGTCPVCSAVFKRHKLSKSIGNGFHPCVANKDNDKIMWIESKHLTAKSFQ